MPGALVERLISIVGAEHVLTGVALSPYVIDGRTPEAAVFPGSVAEVRAVISFASEAGAPVVPWGGGTAVTVGSPAPTSALVLGLGRLHRIVEHEPGDLTTTVEAGVTLTALQTALRARGQWLSLDPPDPDRATIGGIIAANASGCRRHLYGTARDLLIGLSVITADGALVRGGGKVVKNVAGYDLPKLFVGSYGTLGVIVEATLKLRPVPDEERFVAVSFGSVKDAGDGVRALMASDLIPNVIELLDVDASRALGLGGTASVVVGFDGLAEQVDWQCIELGRLLSAPARPLTDDARARLAGIAREAFLAPASVMRFSVLPTHIADTIEEGSGAARARGLGCAWSAHAGVGVLTGVLAAPEERAAPGSEGGSIAERVAGVLRDWRAIARANGGWATLEWAPLAVKSVVPVWDDVGAAARIMQRIKAELDPKNILNPGRFASGI